MILSSGHRTEPHREVQGATRVDRAGSQGKVRHGREYDPWAVRRAPLGSAA